MDNSSKNPEGKIVSVEVKTEGSSKLEFRKPSKWPEKIKMIDKAYSVNMGSDNYKIGFNEGVKLCTAVKDRDYVRKDSLPSVGELTEILRKVYFAGYNGYAHANEAATAIRERMEGKLEDINGEKG